MRVDCRFCGQNRYHHSRGLCRTCYRRATEDGTIDDWPCRKRPADDVLEDWDMLRREGYSMVQAAPRIGVSPDALEMAIVRARRRGDPRAVADYRGMKAYRRASREAS